MIWELSFYSGLCPVIFSNTLLGTSGLYSTISSQATEMQRRIPRSQILGIKIANTYLGEIVLSNPGEQALLPLVSLSLSYEDSLMLTLQSRLTKCLPHRLKSQLLLTQRSRLWRTKDDDALSAFAAEHVADLLSHQCVTALPAASSPLPNTPIFFLEQ